LVAYLDDASGAEPSLPKDHPERRVDVEQLTALGEKLHRSIRFVTFRWGLGRLGRLNVKKEAQLKTLAKEGLDGENLVEFYAQYSRNSIADNVYYEHLNALCDGYPMLEGRLGDGRAFITGDTLTISDVIWAMKTLKIGSIWFSVQFPISRGGRVVWSN
jgi:glutathione S-transferase